MRAIAPCAPVHTTEHVQQAIAAAAAARREWAAGRWEDRAAVILRAAELLADDLARRRINAATMLGPVEDGVPGGDRRGVAR